jgi:TusA-related sulfurtransferase
LQKFDFSRYLAIWRISCAEVLLKMQRGDVLCVKRAHVQSRNEIQEIVMDSDSDEEKYYTSEDM